MHRQCAEVPRLRLLVAKTYPAIHRFSSRHSPAHGCRGQEQRHLAETHDRPIGLWCLPSKSRKNGANTSVVEQQGWGGGVDGEIGGGNEGSRYYLG